MRYEPKIGEQADLIIKNFPLFAAERLRYAGIRVNDSYDFQYDRAYSAVGHLTIEYTDGARWYIVGDARIFWLFDGFDLWPNGDVSAPAHVNVWISEGRYVTNDVRNKSFTPIARR